MSGSDANNEVSMWWGWGIAVLLSLGSDDILSLLGRCFARTGSFTIFNISQGITRLKSTKLRVFIKQNEEVNIYTTCHIFYFDCVSRNSTYLNHTRIRSWNQLAVNEQRVTFFCSKKRQEPLKRDQASTEHVHRHKHER